jgi:hypothetical protein
MVMTLDLTKPVQTRDGRKVRIVCTDYANTYKRPIIGLIAGFDDGRFGHEMMQVYALDGTCTTAAQDLVNVPEKRWLNIYTNNPGLKYHTSREAARKEGLSSSWSKYYLKTIEVDLCP